MTHVYGYARDPETGDPVSGVEVVASIFPRGAATFPPVGGGVDKVFTGMDGRWELVLPPTSGSGATMRIREWLLRTLYLDIPDVGGDLTPIDAETIQVEPGTGQPPEQASLYLTRAELGQVSGVAQLDSGGKIPLAQLPVIEGTDGQLLLSRVAGDNLGGHRVVTLNESNQLVYASNDNSGQIEAPLWLTLGAISSGAIDSVLAFGPITEPSWSWNPGPVYLDVDGLLTQDAPEAPALFAVQVGYATSTRRIVFDRRTSLALTQE
jgi:hypothetical protein